MVEMRHTGLVRRVLVAAAITVAIFAMAMPAYAAPTTSAYKKHVKSIQAQIDAYNTQLDKLTTDAEIASEAYNKASDELTATTAKIGTSETDLANARAALALQSQILDNRVSSMYKDGSLNTFQIIMESKSVSDFVGRIKYLNTVGANDANLAGGLKAQKTLMETQLQQLKIAQAQQQEQQFELKARQVEVNLKIADAEKLQKAASADLKAYIAKQEAANAGEQSALVSSILSGANKNGIVATPGTPVETALAYLGIKYIWAYPSNPYDPSPSGFDCSGLVLYTFNQHGVTLPHYSGSQARLGTKVALANIQPNDVVFFGSPIHHVGIYAGGGYFIEAPHTGAFVRLAKLSGRSDIATVRRYDWQLRTAPIRGVK
jgi:peptidoglycan DL-endopeptidase CwlO